jgi:hypothetical protein
MTTATTWPIGIAGDYQSGTSWGLYQNGSITTNLLTITNTYIAGQGLATDCWALTGEPGTIASVAFNISGNVNMLLPSGTPDPNLNTATPTGGCQKTN